MAKHEFGIMPDAPVQGRRYDDYEPYKYNCISVDDDFVEIINADLNNLDFYWHTVDVKGKGLAYCGVTLIPPCEIQSFIEVSKEVSALSELKKLCEKALREDKWIIHFGL